MGYKTNKYIVLTVINSFILRYGADVSDIFFSVTNISFDTLFELYTIKLNYAKRLIFAYGKQLRASTFLLLYLQYVKRY